jgi:hypothetical protein
MSNGHSHNTIGATTATINHWYTESSTDIPPDLVGVPGALLPNNKDIKRFIVNMTDNHQQPRPAWGDISPEEHALNNLLIANNVGFCSTYSILDGNYQQGSASVHNL